jgi:hypothetical protein
VSWTGDRRAATGTTGATEATLDLAAVTAAGCSALAWATSDVSTGATKLVTGATGKSLERTRKQRESTGYETRTSLPSGLGSVVPKNYRYRGSGK